MVQARGKVKMDKDRTSGMVILFAGAYGMVGRNFLEHPDIHEFKVLSPSSSALNLLDYPAVRKYISDNKPEMIIHAAGRVGGIQANMNEPVRFLVENLDMGRNLILAAREAGIKKLINLGSSCMYPRNAPNPLKEEMLLQGELEPTNEGYALAKITVARLCEYVTREDPEYQYKTLIPCNLYGRWDKFDPLNSHMIPAVIRKIHEAVEAGKQEIEVWGSGKARREFMYSGDLADCLMNSVKRFDSLPSIMNVGIGHDYTINEYYSAISEMVGFEGEFVHDLSKPEGMQQKLVDTGRLNAIGWKPGTGLREGIAKTYEFYLEQIAKQ